MGRISPELVLVDPELGELLRELLPEPGDCLAPRLRVALELAVARDEPVALPRAVAPAPRATKRRSYARRLAWVGVAGLLASPLLAFVNVTHYRPVVPSLVGVSPPASSPAEKGPTSVGKPPVGSQPETTEPKAKAKAKGRRRPRRRRSRTRGRHVRRRRSRVLQRAGARRERHRAGPVPPRR